MLRLSGEIETRRAVNDTMMVTIVESDYHGKKFCRIHQNFKTSNIINKDFEELMRKYHATEVEPRNITRK